MRVYLDFQVWDYINKNENVRAFFVGKQEWSYLISVAHLEELYKARKSEKDDKIGLTDKLEKTIREIAENGVIKPTPTGVKFIPKSFEKTYSDIVDYDTQNVIWGRSLLRRDIDKGAYDPKDLFEGIKCDKNKEYKIVWQTERVKDELLKRKDNCIKLILELSNPNNELRKVLTDQYGKIVAEQKLYELIENSKIEIKPCMYPQIRDNYGALEYVMEQLFFVLTRCGFKRDGSDKHANSGTYDIQHSISATLCDIFITNDISFAEKFRAVVFYLGIPLTIKTWKEDIVPELEKKMH